MSHSARIDIFWTPLIAHLSQAASLNTEIPPRLTLTRVTDQLASAAIPIYSPISNACRGDRLNRTEVVEACRAVASAMMRGDSIITEVLGTTIAKRVWPTDSEEWLAAEATRLRLRDLMTKMDGINAKDNEATAARDVSLFAQYPREEDFLRARMIADGLDPDAPMSAE